MGRCNSGDHIASHHINMEITTSYIDGPQQKGHPLTVINRLLEGELIRVLLEPNLRH